MNKIYSVKEKIMVDNNNNNEVRESVKQGESKEYIQMDFSLTTAEARVKRVEEIIANTGISEKFLKDAQDFGLIQVLADNRHFDEYALRTARVIAALSEFGIEPRHLKILKSGTDRDVSLIKQIVSPLARSKRPDASEQAQEMMKEIANLTNQLHAILVHHDLESEII